MPTVNEVNKTRRVIIAKWLNAFKEAQRFELRLLNYGETPLAYKKQTRVQILSRINRHNSDGGAYTYLNENKNRNIFGRPEDVRFVLLDLDTIQSKKVELALALNPRVHLQSSEQSSQQWYFVPWITNKEEQRDVARYLCDEVGISYSATRFNQIGRLPYFMNVKPNRPGRFRAQILHCDSRAIANVLKRDVIVANRERVLRGGASTDPRPKSDAKPANKRKREVTLKTSDGYDQSRHDWQAAMKSFENGYTYADTHAYLYRISKKQHEKFDVYIDELCKDAQYAFKLKSQRRYK